MTATPEELLRLARKAFPGRDVRVRCRDDGDRVESVTYDLLLVKAPRDRLHAALLVLSGELDLAELQAQNAALVAERERLENDLIRSGGQRVGAVMTTTQLRAELAALVAERDRLRELLAEREADVRAWNAGTYETWEEP